jgi:hypothetical protein
MTYFQCAKAHRQQVRWNFVLVLCGKGSCFVSYQENNSSSVELDYSFNENVCIGEATGSKG